MKPQLEPSLMSLTPHFKEPTEFLDHYASDLANEDNPVCVFETWYIKESCLFIWACKN